MKKIFKPAATILLLLLAGIYAQAQNNTTAKPEQSALPALSPENQATDLSTAAERKNNENNKGVPAATKPNATETVNFRERTGDLKTVIPAEDKKPVQPATDSKTVEKLPSKEISPQNNKPAANAGPKIAKSDG
jgi:hypothetical protein